MRTASETFVMGRKMWGNESREGVVVSLLRRAARANELHRVNDRRTFVTYVAYQGVYVLHVRGHLPHLKELGEAGEASPAPGSNNEKRSRAHHRRLRSVWARILERSVKFARFEIWDTHNSSHWRLLHPAAAGSVQQVQFSFRDAMIEAARRSSTPCLGRAWPSHRHRTWPLSDPGASRASGPGRSKVLAGTARPLASHASLEVGPNAPWYEGSNA